MTFEIPTTNLEEIQMHSTFAIHFSFDTVVHR